MDWQHIFWPALVALIWALKELTVTIRKRYSERPPPLPPPRSEMVTPTAGYDRAGQSGSYAAVVPSDDQYVTRKELRELREDMHSQYGAVVSALHEMAVGLGELKGKLDTMTPTRRPVR